MRSVLPVLRPFDACAFRRRDLAVGGCPVLRALNLVLPLVQAGGLLLRQFARLDPLVDLLLLDGLTFIDALRGSLRKGGHHEHGNQRGGNHGLEFHTLSLLKARDNPMHSITPSRAIR